MIIKLLKAMRIIYTCLITIFLSALTGLNRLPAQSGPFLSHLTAGRHFPLYTGYAAAMQRSSFILDEGYRLRYDVDSLAPAFVTDNAGETGWAFSENGQWVYRAEQYYLQPVITVSYPDMVIYHCYPFRDVRVEVGLVVHSSAAAFWKIKITNNSNQTRQLDVASFIRNGPGVFQQIYSDPSKGTLLFTHKEEPDGWTKQHHIPYVDSIRDLFSISRKDGLTVTTGLPFLQHEGVAKAKQLTDSSHAVAFMQHWTVPPHHSDSFRLFRIVQPADHSPAQLLRLADSLSSVPVQYYQKENEALFSHTPVAPCNDTALKALYWSACNMMRQVFYPPEGNLKHNYYVFSREPQWGWGHGGQVFHESIAMLAYAFIDPQSAMNSMRVFAERQYPNGYINYRTGAYLDEQIEYKGQLTSSAPWYAWLNWEVYQITKDTAFLREMYSSSKRFYDFYTSHRDTDHDGLCEWGGEAVLESVRDGLVAVWDQVGYPASFEALDLNCMLVMEAKSLEKMAVQLHLPEEAAAWRKDYRQRSRLINQTFWDPVNHFYYNVDKTTHTFTYKKKDDLKRDEIIGFLPLWAGVADKKQAAWLVKHLTDTASFWRRYGIPSLSAADPYYNPRGYWNGPVWVQWNYLIERGLLDYGYKKVAQQLVQKVSDNMIAVLKKDHELWEFYDPDSVWGGYHRTYIWAGIINRMIMDLQYSKKKN